MATKRNTTVAARLSDELFARLNACIAAEVAARPRVDKVGDFGRGVLGLDRWPVDVLRHTFATYGIALTGDAGRVAHWMGHEGDSGTIYRHYRGLATKADAERFFALRP